MPAAKKTTKPKTTAKRAAKTQPPADDRKPDRSSSLDQLSHKLRDLRQDLIRQLNQIRAGSTTNVRRPQQLRRQIARHLTVINERRRGRSETATEATAEPDPAQTTAKPAPSRKPKPKAKAQTKKPAKKK